MPRQPNKNKEVEAPWAPDLNHVFSISPTGAVLLGGQQIDAITLENLKSEASMARSGVLFQVLGATLESSAIQLALKKISIKDSPDSRSTQLAYAQAMTDINVQLWTFIHALAKL